MGCLSPLFRGPDDSDSSGDEPNANLGAETIWPLDGES
jgi:hypothetical protein